MNRAVLRTNLGGQFAAACGFAIALALCPRAAAVQHLVRPGDDWQNLGARLRPGDEIILMPGRHRGASFDRLVGTSERPITIRGADLANPACIGAEREGIRIWSAAWVVIKDLQISGATVNGVTLGEPSAGRPGNGGTEAEPQGQPPPQNRQGDVLIRNVTISRTGPRGQRHGIQARGLTNLRIEDCRIEGWGGSGIELIGCHDVQIARCRLTGLDDYSQVNGIRARAGSAGVQIEECRIENAGVYAVCAGGASNAEDFTPALPESAAAATLFEATGVRLERNLIMGGQCALALINADDCVARNNTIVRPRRCVLALLAEQKDPRFSPGRRGVFGMNLIVWEPGDLRRLTEVAPGVETATFTLDCNLWWSSETAEARAKLGPLPGKQLAAQTTDVDPKLDSSFKPSEPQAQAFGW